MKKNSFLRIINPILAAVFLYQVATGFLHGVIPRKSFETFHVTGAVVLIICAVIHLIFNWSWVKTNFLKNRKTDVKI